MLKVVESVTVWRVSVIVAAGRLPFVGTSLPDALSLPRLPAFDSTRRFSTHPVSCMTVCHEGHSR